MLIRWEDQASVPIFANYDHVLAASIIDYDDKPLMWFVHEYKAESYGTWMRSTFRLPAKMPQFILDGLHKHNEEEMEQFPKFLQELYQQKE